MNKILFLFSLLFALILFLGSTTFAQTFNHNTGNIQVTVFENGYVGHGGLGAGGSGVTFMGAGDACFTAGVMYGNAANGISGMVGSFTDVNNVVLIEDLVNTVPITNYSLPDFDQVTSCQYKDNLAPVPYGVTVDQTTYSNTGDDFIFIRLDITNPTASAINNFYVGMFADWDVGGTSYLNNLAGLDQARNLVYQYLSGGSPDPNFYGIIAFDGLVGGTANDQFPGDETTIRLTILDWMSMITVPGTSMADYRSFIGAGPYNIPAGATVMTGFGVVAGQDLASLQSNTDNAQAVWNSLIVPVELTSFSASANNAGNVVLNWTTATEMNNRIFEIERKDIDNPYVTVGFVKGAGTTTEPQSYSFIDKNVNPGSYTYRLKQIDFDGRCSYSDPVEVHVAGPTTFNLSQNYPNPFNPATNISFTVPEAGNVRLAVYNALGQEVSVLVNGMVTAGLHNVTFNASSLPSGAYIYKLQSSNSVMVKKMMLMK
jgi:hypothetical protein